MKENVSERRLVDILVSFLRRRNYVERGLRHYEKTIDIVAVCLESGELTAIEAKTKNWRRAMEQAIVNLAAVERSYIAIYSDFAHRVSLEELDRHGIGLISVGSQWDDVEVVKEAVLSPFVNLLMNKRIKDKLLPKGAK